MKKTLLFALLALALIAPGQAYAHSHYDHSDPADGAAVSGSPDAVTIWFTEALDPEQADQSWIHVLSEDGARVDMNDSTIIGTDNDGLLVSLAPGLSPGVYRVTWQNISDDGAGLTGSFSFGVGMSPPVGSGAMESGDDDMEMD